MIRDKMMTNKEWIYVWDSLISEKATIDGVSIWDKGWELKKKEIAVVTDPIYGKKHSYPVYEYTKNKTIRMALAEHTPGVYLAFVDDPNLVKKVHPKSNREIKFK